MILIIVSPQLMCISLNPITYVRFKVQVILKVLSNIWAILKCLLCLVSQWSGNFPSTWLLSKPSGSFWVRIKNIIASSTSPPKILTTSSTTASVVWDWVPTDEANLHTCTCILILTKRDGTPFNVTSVLEEDIIEICIWLGHTHPMGVLCYSVT